MTDPRHSRAGRGAWPDLAVLELLVAVSEHGGLGAAARAIGMAQPNASRAMARLERSLGLELLERHPRGSRLTPEGATVADWARRVLDEARELMTASTALRAGRAASLDVAASMTVAEYLAPAWLAELRRVRATEVRLRVANSTEVVDLVSSGACEVGFIESPDVAGGLRSATVAHDRLVVVVAPGHPWARRRRPVTIAELAATPLVVREAGSGTRTTLAYALAGHEVVPPTLELGSNAAVRVSVESGAGPAVLSELAVAGWIDRGELVEVRIDGLDLRRSIRAVWRPGAQPTDAAAELVAIAARSRHARPA
ncbi:LysR family transcriptional regulator [Agromyces sp. G08B096]|uniref:LysR family transcriptional regulator n=1 Tax=Agromyces sp. G08B096 TaxID=3156399 RepID=A0AAU7W7T4_9MICO